MKSSRRNFLKIAGVSAVGLSAKPVLNAFATADTHAPKAAPAAAHDKAAAHEEKALAGKRWALVIDTPKLQTTEALEPIIEACNKIHNVPHIENKRHEIKWIWEEEFKHAFPGKEDAFLPDHIKHNPFLVLCNHCENPPCVRACPTKATFQREDGIVLMDFHRCIGCRFCMAACPYGSRSFNFRDPRPFINEQNPAYPTRTKGVVEKCNFCAERLAVGKQPSCVEASGGALIFGDMNDPASEVRKVLNEKFTIRRKQGLGTSPMVFYIV